MKIPAPLIVTHDAHPFIHHRERSGPAELSPPACLQCCPSPVIDAETLQLVEVLRLHEAVDHTCSAVGSAVLLRSLAQPGTDRSLILRKQDSLREIASDDGLRGALSDCVREYSQGESALFKFINKGLYALFPYPDLKRARKAAGSLSRAIESLPRAASSYLQALLSHLQRYRASSVDRMMRGAIYTTIGGIKSGAEVGFFTPKLKFAPRRFTEWALAGPALILAPGLYGRLGFETALSPWLAPIGIGVTGLYAFYSLVVKPVRDTGKFIEPFRQRCVTDGAFGRSLDAIGMIDELLSCHDFHIRSPHPTVLPEVRDEDCHFFEAIGLNNPVLAREKTDIVPNAVHLHGARLTFVTGPNSGGKTTLCKSVVQNQLLAQMGSYVLAGRAALNIAEHIRYQAPKFDALQDAEGRFGSELARTRDIFFSTTPKSLVIFDELAEGTTHEERLDMSFSILSDFFAIGNNTVLVTHNHSLVDRFSAEGKGQGLMAEFEGESPSYRVVPGTSCVSHADRIARRIGFSGEDRRRYLQAKRHV